MLSFRFIFILIVFFSYFRTSLAQTSEPAVYAPYTNLYSYNDPFETRIDHYQSRTDSKKTLTTFFSTHTAVQEDRDLKRFHKKFSEDWNEEDIRRIENEVKARLRIKSSRLRAFKEGLNALYELHEQEPFVVIYGEYSFGDEDRYKKRIEVAESLMGSLMQSTSLSLNQVRDFILLLTGPDVFSLLEGEPLSSVLNIPGENKDIMANWSVRLSRCLSTLNLLKISRDEEAKRLGEALLSFLSPLYEEKDIFLEEKNSTIEIIKSSGLHQLRIGANSPKESEELLNSCDVLYDLSRDIYTASLIFESELEGPVLLTKGRAHRDLFHTSYENVTARSF